MAYESSHNDAGHPFLDLRSAARSKQRRRKHLERYNHFRGLTPSDLPSAPSQQSHYLPTNYYFHPSLGSFPADLSTAPIAKFTKREAYAEAQYSRPVIKHHSRVKNNSLKWEKRWHDKKQVVGQSRDAPWEGREDLWWEKNFQHCFWDQELDTLVAFRSIGVPMDWEGIGSWEEWTEVGETFSRWAQRRIHEMRQVKEERLRAKLEAQSAATTSTSASISTLSSGRDEDEDEGYHSSTSASSTPSNPPTTTLPTTESDIHAHSLLRRALTPHCKWIKFPHTYGFWWFGEYEWYWHRNATGCWFVDEYTCAGHWCPPCSCKEFEEYGRWDPEGPQACLLEEWLEEGWEGNDEDRDGDAGESDGMEEGEDFGEWGEDDWDVISMTTTSETWMEVDDDCGSDLDFI